MKIISLEQAFAEYKHKFGKSQNNAHGMLPYEIAVELIEAVSNTPIEDVEDIGQACL